MILIVPLELLMYTDFCKNYVKISSLVRKSFFIHLELFQWNIVSSDKYIILVLNLNYEFLLSIFFCSTYGVILKELNRFKQDLLDKKLILS